MSGGQACTCTGPDRRAGWVVIDRCCNYSAFNGRRRTPSRYSACHCKTCGAVWRTDAAYVAELPDQ